MARLGRYIVLRDCGPFRRQGPSPASGAADAGAVSQAEAQAEPSVEICEMPVREARQLERDPEVLEIARSMPVQLIRPVPADAGEEEAALYDGASAWGVAAVGAADSPFDGAGVAVAVLDTGIDAAHPAFAGVELTCRDFTADGGGDTAPDVNGHGTHCAGTVFGRDVDGKRIGVAPGVSRALIGKVLSDDGSGSSEVLFEAMRWAAESDARVISMSLGFDFPGYSQRLVEEYDLPVVLATSLALEGYRMNLRMFDRIMDLFRAKSAFDGGRLVVAASGNESERQIDPSFEVSASVPAAAQGVVSVGALGRGPGGLVVAPFSNSAPTLSAPGVAVASAQPGGGLSPLSGTSMACPHVAGVAALWWQALEAADVPLTWRAVEARLLAAARQDGFAEGTDIADRGQGLVTAPSGRVA